MRGIGVGAPPAPDITGEWIVPITQTCKETNKGLKCKVSGTLKVKNVGNEDAPSSFVRFYLPDHGIVRFSLPDNSVSAAEDILLKQVSTGTLKMGKGKAKKLRATLPLGMTASGNSILARIDADNTVNEADENNNNIAFGPIP